MRTNVFSAAIPILVLFAIASPLFGETPEEREFKQLREQHDQATAAALEPINRRYQQALQQLLHRAPTTSQPELARLVTAEIQATGGAVSVTTAATNPTLPSVTAKQPAKADLKRLFEDSQWESYSGSDAVPDKKHGAFIFKRDGTFVSGEGWGGWEQRHWWEVEAPDVLKIYQDPPKSKNPKIWTFRVDFNGKTAKVDVLLGGASGDGFIKYDKPFKAH